MLENLKISHELPAIKAMHVFPFLTAAQALQVRSCALRTNSSAFQSRESQPAAHQPPQVRRQLPADFFFREFL